MINKIVKEQASPGQDFSKLKDKIEEIKLIGIELTQSIIDVDPNEQIIFDKKAKKDKIVENKAYEKLQDKVFDKKNNIAIEITKESIEKTKVFLKPKEISQIVMKDKKKDNTKEKVKTNSCLLYTSPSPRD